MGRIRSSITSPIPKEKKPLSSTERSRKRRLDPSKREDDNLRRRIARQLKVKITLFQQKSYKKKREDDRLRKAKSRLNQSRQKRVGTKLQNRNRKRD